MVSQSKIEDINKKSEKDWIHDNNNKNYGERYKIVKRHAN